MKLQMPLLLLVLAISGVYALGRRNHVRKKRCVVLISAVMGLFSGLRSWWMGDLIKYYTLYRRCVGPEWAEVVAENAANTGIRWFFRLAGWMGISYDNCLLIIAVFVAVTLGILIYRYSPSPFWSYLMYIAMGFYLFTYSGLKQTIAMGFLTLAVMAMFEDKPGKFLLWVGVGSLFHAPALIFLAAWPFCRQKINSRYFLVLLGVFAGMFLFRTQIGGILSELYYDEQDSFVLADTFEVGGRFLMMLLIMALGVFLRPLHDWDRVYVQVFNLMVIAAALQTMSVFDNNFTRLADYYYQFIVLFIPMMMELGGSQARKMPEHRHEIQYYDPNIYVLLSIGILAFGLWYYNGFISSSWAILKDFVFRWEIDPYALYGS